MYWVFCYFPQDVMIARPTDVLALLWVLLFGVLLGSSRTVVFPFSVKKRSASVQPEAL